MAGGKRLYDDTGFAPIDAEHLALSRAIETFIAKVNLADVAVVRPQLLALVDAVTAHFAHEEELMVDFGYPSAAEHKEAHGLFVADAKRSLAEVRKKGLTPEVRRWAVGRLPEWFRYHILTHDMGLGRFLRDAGARAWRGATPPPLPRKR